MAKKLKNDWFHPAIFVKIVSLLYLTYQPHGGLFGIQTLPWGLL